MLQMALMLSMAQEVEAEQQPALEAAAPAAPTAEAGPATIFEAPTTDQPSASQAATPETPNASLAEAASASVAAEAVVAPTPEKKKKKKKKQTYAQMMAEMTKGSPSADKEKERVKVIQGVTGGGAFSKLDKI
jgi:hypothetical protein